MMARLSKMVDNVSILWRALPVESRNEILTNVQTAHRAMKRVADLIPADLQNAVLDLVKAGAQAALMPFGPGLEGVIVDVCGAIPELSAYVRQLLGD